VWYFTVRNNRPLRSVTPRASGDEVTNSNGGLLFARRILQRSDSEVHFGKKYTPFLSTFEGRRGAS